MCQFNDLPAPPGNWMIGMPVLTVEDYNRAYRCLMHYEIALGSKSDEFKNIAAMTEAWRQDNWSEARKEWWYGAEAGDELPPAVKAEIVAERVT